MVKCMCELDVIILKDNVRELVMESVTKILVNENEIELFGILGDKGNVNGVIKLIDFSKGEIIITSN